MTCKGNCKMCKNVKKGLKDIKEGKTTSFSNIEEMFKRLEERRKTHPIKYAIKDCYNALKRFVEYIIGTPRRIKWFIQRSKRGWANCDVWNLDYSLAKIIIGSVKQLKEIGHGLPTKTDKNTDKQAEKEWNKILDNIIYTFEIAKKVSDGDLIYIPIKEYNKTKRDNLVRSTKKLNKKHPIITMKVMTKKESERYERGFDLLKEWYLALWD